MKSRVLPFIHVVAALVLVVAVVGFPVFSHTCRMMDDCGSGELCRPLPIPDQPSCCAESSVQQEDSPSLPSRQAFLPTQCCFDIDMMPPLDVRALHPSSFLGGTIDSATPDLLPSLPQTPVFRADGASPFLDDASPPGPPLWLSLSSLLI